MFSLFSQTQKNIQTLNAQEFKKIIDSGTVTLIDVRTPEEFASAHIKGAININCYEEIFEAKVKTVSHNKPIAVYCHMGVRSKSAASKLSHLNVKIYNLEGGIDRWMKAGYPTQK